MRNNFFIGTIFGTMLQCTLLLGVPVITNVSPQVGPNTGGTAVTITGSGFAQMPVVSSVNFGTTPATSFLVNSDTSLTAITPLAAPGVVDVQVTAGTMSAITHASKFVYQGPWVACIPCQGILTSTLDKINIPGVVVTDTIPLLGTDGFASIAITPDGRTAFLGDLNTNIVKRVDLVTHSIVDIPIGGTFVFSEAITPDGTKVFATCMSGSSLISVINTNNNSVTNITNPFFVGLTSIAISPNGATAYVIDTDGNAFFKMNTETLVVSGPFTAAPNPLGCTVTPDGAFLYITHTQGGATNGTVTKVNLSTNATVATIPVGINPNNIAITPDGTKAYVTNFSSTSSVSSIVLATNAVTNIPVSPIPIDVAITPDGTLAYVLCFSGDSSANVTRINVSTNMIITPTIPTDPFPTAIAITPDQSPFSNFTISPINQAFAFDASSSVSPTNIIASYIWNFGDGNTLTTSSPTTTHTYSFAGSFVPSLTVTNSTGTSNMQLFGKTMSRNGGLNAFFSQTFVGDVAITPPTNFNGTNVKEIFLTQYAVGHRLTWTPSTDSRVTGYHIYRNGVLIATIPATGPYAYLDQGRLNQIDTYVLTAFDAFGTESTPLTIVVQ